MFFPLLFTKLKMFFLFTIYKTKKCFYYFTKTKKSGFLKRNFFKKGTFLKKGIF